MDVLMLRGAGFGCKLAQRYLGCLLYADDIVLLAHSLNAIVKCLVYARNLHAWEYDMKLNSSKSVAMRIGERYKVKCESLMLDGSELQFVETLKYLGVQFVAAKKLACSVENVRVKCYRTFNAIHILGVKELNRASAFT